MSGRFSRFCSGAWALLALLAGVGLALAHPLSPPLALAALLGVVALGLWRRNAWLFLVPALLPLANAAPWSGWLMFEEFDLLLLAVLIAGHARRAWSGGIPLPRPALAVAALLAASVALACWRGVADAGGWQFNLFADYFDPLNTLRLAKSTVYVLLLLPLLHDALRRDHEAAIAALARGMVVGLALVTLAVLCERMLFPGLFDFAQPYRTTAWFWEMHVGGAALDAYLVLAAPFALWAVLAAPGRLTWLAASCLVLLFAYACLTTFARGVYLGIAVALVLFSLLALHRRFPGWTGSMARLGAYLGGGLLLTVILALLYWMLGAALALVLFGVVAFGALIFPKRRIAGFLLVLALAIEAVAIVHGGSFMLDRLAASNRDFGKRLQHWQNGVDLLAGTSDWLFGKGLGRLPAQYASHYRSGEMSGRARLAVEDGDAYLRLTGPVTRQQLAGLFALTQRVSIAPDTPLRVEMKVRSRQMAVIAVRLCEQHLLYPANCLERSMRLPAGDGRWHPLVFDLAIGEWPGGPWREERPQIFDLAVLTPGAAVDFDHMAVIWRNDNVLANGEFVQGLQRWFPAAQYYFIPWHIDNFFLELLVERGLFGCLAFAGLLLLALRRLLAAARSGQAGAHYLLAALAGVLTLGLVSSLLDVPRVSTLLHLLLFAAISMTPARVLQDNCA